MKSSSLPIQESQCFLCKINEKFTPCCLVVILQDTSEIFTVAEKKRQASSRLPTRNRRNQRSADGAFKAGENRTENPELRSWLPHHPGAGPRRMPRSCFPPTDPAIEGFQRMGQRAKAT